MKTGLIQKDRPALVTGEIATPPGHACLNCGQELHGHFCSNCGQKSSTHRYSVVSFFTHDLVHSLWHVDKSIFKTLREIMIRPGITAKRNIEGQRVRYFPVLTLLLLLVGFYLFVLHNEFVPSDQGEVTIGKWEISELVYRYQKWLLLGLVPVLAAASWIVFWRVKYNYAEHLVVTCYGYAGVFAWLCIANFIPDHIPDWLNELISYAFVCFFSLAQWQAFHTHYRTAGWLWRTFAFWAMTIVLLLMVLVAVVIFAHDKVGLETT